MKIPSEGPVVLPGILTRTSRVETEGTEDTEGKGLREEKLQASPNVREKSR